MFNLLRSATILLLSFVIFNGCNKGRQLASSNNNNSFRTVGYLSFNRPDILSEIKRVEFPRLTHLNLAFINPAASGSFPNYANLQQVIDKAHSSNVKVLMSMGGGEIPAYFTSLLEDDKRSAFISAIAATVAKYGFDGVDVDIENDAINNQYGKFVIELAAVIGPQKKLLTAALATWNGDKIPIEALEKFDFINIMSYDKTGPWDPSHPGQHAPYNMAENDLAYWAGKRLMPKEKLTLGLPFYGYAFGNNKAPSTLLYREIVADYPGAENKDELKLNSGQTVYYNGIPTIKQKTYLAMKQASGVMIWELTQDAVGNLSLLKAIQDTEQGQ